ncbi:MAG: PTS sugar transporter subunit IIA [Eubacteriales bacterium]|nr:PTS sugar transporter subunit IIA [Eubacteriales bacterium]
MIHMIVTSHGGMAEGMMQSVEMLLGEQKEVECVSLAPDMGADELNEVFAEKLKNVSEKDEYLILCDLRGGTPFNVVSRYSFKNEHIAVMYGMNLPMLIAALMERQGEGQTVQELAASILKQLKETMGLSEL